MTRRRKQPGVGNPAIDLEALVAAVGRFEIATGTHSEDTGGFTPWDSLMLFDAEGLLKALVGNRAAALVVLRAAGFKTPVAGNALTDPKAARELAKAVYHWLDGHKRKSIIGAAFASIAAGILREWCTIVAPRAAPWESETAVVRVLGAGAYMVFARRDADVIGQAAADAEQARLVRKSQSTSGKRGGKNSGHNRRDEARARKEEFWKLVANSNLSDARASKKLGVSVRTVQRYRKEKTPTRTKLRVG